MLLKDSLLQGILTVCSKKGEGDPTNLVGNVNSVWNKTSDILQNRGTFEKYGRAPHLYLHYTPNADSLSFKTFDRGKKSQTQRRSEPKKGEIHCIQVRLITEMHNKPR